MLPTSKFLHDMGVASIVAGFILLGLAQLPKRRGQIKQAVKRAR